MPTKQKFSVGTDIIDVARIKKLIKNKNFLDRIFSKEEIHYCSGKKNAAQHFAVRFAAKEAVWKAFTPFTLIKGISHNEISVQRTMTGKPYVQLSARLKKFEKN